MLSGLRLRGAIAGLSEVGRPVAADEVSRSSSTRLHELRLK
jgi:hypothetical protein